MQPMTTFNELLTQMTNWSQLLAERKEQAQLDTRKTLNHDQQLATTFQTPETAAALRNNALQQPLIEGMRIQDAADDITRHNLAKTEVDITACDLGIRTWGGVGSFWQVGTIGARNTAVGTIGQDAGLKRGVQL